jgi:hypothetical protein
MPDNQVLWQNYIDQALEILETKDVRVVAKNIADSMILLRVLEADRRKIRELEKEINRLQSNATAGGAADV